MSSLGYDGATIEKPTDDIWSWLFGNVWVSRILVTVLIAVLLEYISRKPVPQILHGGAKEKENEATDRVREKAAARAEKALKIKEQQKQATATKETNDKAILLDKKPVEDENIKEAAKVTEGPAETEESDEKVKESVAEKPAKEKHGSAKKKDKKAGEAPATEEETPRAKPIFRNKSPYHPGMQGFHNWYDIETSLFRQYTVGRSDGVDTMPPYVQKSRNGQVRVALQVTNDLTLSTENQVINVFWMNYLGHEEAKGTIHRGETWTQTTFVEHPWVFRLSDTNELLLHYIPERVIPHLEEAPTIEEANPMVGVQRITITRPTDQAQRDHHICSVVDKVLPHPGRHHFHNPNQAISWTLLQMTRSKYFDYHPGATLLCKYLTNIAMHPDNPHYRHIRIANKSFYHGIWQTPARGLLLAAGFCEQHANAELGTAAPLPAERVQDVSLVLFRLEQYLTHLEQQQQEAAASTSADRAQQPEGADGSGRSGYGQAGQMNVRR